jgi:hypothetical protein
MHLTFARPFHPLISPKLLYTNRGNQLLPAVSLLPETLSVLIAPEEMLARALNGNPHLQQFRILFVTGIRSGILEHAGPRLPGVRGAFTSVRAVDHPGG